jgi:hypothetical protein
VADKLSVCKPSQDLLPALPLGIITRGEVLFVAYFTLVICVITTIPYLVGHAVSVPGTIFTDELVHSFDMNNYFAYAHQASLGDWLFRNPMTSEPHTAVFFNVEWLTIGKLSTLAHVPLGIALQIVRLVATASMCVAAYWLSSFLFSATLIRRIALVMIMAGGGFGWLASLHLLHIRVNSNYFIDLTNGNLFPFYWALKIPHFIASEAFVVLGSCLFLRAEHQPRVHYYMEAALCYMIAGACRPYDMLFLMCATVLYLLSLILMRRERPKHIALRAIPVLMPVPLLGYYFWLFKMHPIFKWWSVAGNPAPPVWLLALGYGLTFLSLPFAIWKLPRTTIGAPRLFVVCSLITAVVFIYTHGFLHFSFQFATNIIVPLVLIVLIGLEASLMKWRIRSRLTTAIVTIVLIGNSLTSLALVGQSTLLASRGDFRVDARLLDSFAWINLHSSPNDVVLADFDIASHIPRYTHNVVFLGYDNAVHFQDKARDLSLFFDPKTPDEFREELVRRNSVRFVLLTLPEAQAVGANRSLFLKEVFRNDSAIVYFVNPRANGSALNVSQPASATTAPQ